jgi:hypothetical protein
LGFGVWGLLFRVEGSGVGVQGSGFSVQYLRFTVQVLGLRVLGSGFWVLGFRVQGSGFRVQGSGFRTDLLYLAGSRFAGFLVCFLFRGSGYRSTSLTRKCTSLGPFRRPIPRVLGGS